MAIRNVEIRLGPITAAAGIITAVEEDTGPKLVTVCQGVPNGVDGQGNPTFAEGKKHAPARIKRRDYCPTCDNDDKMAFRKASPTADGGVILINSHALEEVAPTDEQKKTLTLTTHPAKQMAGAFASGKTYYLQAAKGAENNYALLAKVIAKRRKDLGFIAEFSFGGPTALYQVVAIDDQTLALCQLARPEQVRDRPKCNGLVVDQFLALADQVADTIAVDFDPKNYRDRRAEALNRLVQEGASVDLATSTTTTAAPVDMGEALTAWLAANQPAKKSEPKPRKTAAPRQRTPRKAAAPAPETLAS